MQGKIKMTSKKFSSLGASKTWLPKSRNLFSALLIMGLSGLVSCSSVPQKVEVVPAEKPVLPPETTKLPLPEAIQLNVIEWTVLPEEEPLTLEEPMFALTTEGYEDAAFNQAEILRWIKEAMTQLRHYRKDEDIVDSLEPAPIADETAETIDEK